MHNHFIRIFIIISTIMSSLWSSNITAAAQSPVQPSVERSGTSLQRQNPAEPANRISQPQAACTPSTSVVNGANVNRFTALGSCTWVVPANTFQIDMLVVAGGGGGGYNAGGGGGGGQVVYASQKVTPGSTLTIAVGAGGTYAYSLITNGTSGGISSVFNPDTSITTIATGGNGGATSTRLGGAAIPAVGVINYMPNLVNLGGGQGGTGNGTFASTIGGAGGAGYRSSITGSATTYGRGGGGGSYFNVGTMAANYGDGAAGGSYMSGGWTGYQGVVIIRESGPKSCPETTSIAAPFVAVCAAQMTNISDKRLWLDQTGLSQNFSAYDGTSPATVSNGPLFVSNISGGIYRFDGLNDYFTRPLVTNAKSNVSLQATFNTSNASKLGQMIAYNGSDAYANGYGLAVNSDTVSNKRLFVLYGGIAWYDTGFTINDNVWYQAVLVISGTTLRVYVDGSQIYTITGVTPNTPSIRTEIGRNDYGNGIRYFNGMISSVTLYNAALTQLQITTLFNGISSNPTPTASSTNTASKTSTPSMTATRSNTPTQTRSNTPSQTSSATQTATNTNTPTSTRTFTSTSTPTSTKTATPTNTPTSTNTVKIAAPTQPRPVLGDNGQIVNWGANAPYKLDRIPNGTNSGIAQVAIGDHHALAVTSAGSVIGWGTNMKGELTIPPLTNVVQVAVGLNHSVALKNNGDVVMWGDPAARTAPIEGALTNITQIATGDRHTLLLRNDGKVFVYGDANQRNTISSIVTTKYIVSVAAGADSSFALGSDGAVYQWGKSISIPTRVSGSVMRIFATGQLYGALRSDGELILFGSAVNNLVLTGQAVNISGSGCPCVKVPSMDGLRSIHTTKWGIILNRRSRQTNVFTYANKNATALPSNMYQISTHYNHVFGVGVAPVDSQLLIPTATPVTDLTLRGTQSFNTTGYLRVWGSDDLIATIPDSASSELRQVVAGARHIAVLRSDGAVVSWGDNRFQQINVPTDLQQSRLLTDTLRIVALAAGANHTMALRGNGTVLAWGNNDAGQSTIPPGLNNVVQVAAGARHSVALLSNGTVQSWGDNSFGQRTQPLLGGVAKIAAAGWHTVALRYDKTVIAWGRNTHGQTEISSYTNVVDIAASNENSILLLATGQIIVVGQNDDNQRIVPPGYYQQIGTSSMQILAINDNAQVVGWGNNGNSQTNIPAGLWNPFQVTGGAGFSAVLIQGGEAPNPTSTLVAPTAPVIPVVATAQVPPIHAQIITIAGGSASSIASFNKSKVAIAPGISATLDGTGLVTTTRQADALLCNIPSMFAAANHHVALGNYGMVLGLDRTVHAWSYCVDDDPTTPYDITNSIPTAFRTNVDEISIRGTHMLILTLDGRIWSNQISIPQMSNITHIAAGRDFAAVLLGNGTVHVFADNNAEGVQSIPSAAINITDIAAGDYHIIALNDTGQIYSWGANQHDVGQADVPYAATQGNVISISAGEQQSIVLLNTGDAVAWGDYPNNTIDVLDTANQAHRISGIATGDRQIMLLIDNNAQSTTSTITPIPSATRLVVPTMTPRANDASFIANQIAWFTMSDFSQPLTYKSAGQIYNTGLIAKQSSVFDGHDANRAIDGNTDGSWYNPNPENSSIIHTLESENPWLQVDLGSVKDISSVTVHNRVDCCMNKLNTAIVFLSNVDLSTSTNIANNKTRAVTWKSLICDNQTACDTDATETEVATFTPGTKARYVRIQLNAIETLHFAEVVISSPPVTFACGSPQACPILNTSDTPNLSFNNNRNTELISSNLINLSNIPFTMRATVKRTSLNRPDVIASIGNPSGVRQYLVLGIDKENRPYCSFYGDDLRSTSWYVDQEWHNYACSYDPRSRVRTLWRDAQIIGQDVVQGAFTPPAAPLIIGRRYDNMTGLTGDIQRLDIINRVLTQSDTGLITELHTISGLVYETQLQSIAPNRSTTRCGSNDSMCPLWQEDSSHDGTAAIFMGNHRLRIDTPLTPNGFSIAYWEKSMNLEEAQSVISHLNSNGTGIRMGKFYNEELGEFSTRCTWTTMENDEPGTFEITDPLTDDEEWHHYLCSFDARNGTLAYYVDGTLRNALTPVYIQTISAPLMVGYTPAGFPNFAETYYEGTIDDLMVYDSAVSAATVAQIYNSTNPPAGIEIPAPTPCESITSCASPTASQTFTATPSKSLTPTLAKSKTALAATTTATMPGITPYTATRSVTRSATATRTLSSTRTFTITLTPTLPSATAYLSPTRTSSNTRTPLSSTQTMLARRSPTMYALTLTATARMQYNQTQTAIARTLTVGTPTVTASAIAYPIPETSTRTSVPYPIPASKTRTATP